MPNDGSVYISNSQSRITTIDPVFFRVNVITNRISSCIEIEIPVSSSDTIAEFKKKVATELTVKQGRPMVLHNPILRHGKRILPDEKLACECKLNHTHTLHMTEMMQIFVKGLDGKVLTILTEHGPSGTNILHFKKLLARKLHEKGYGYMSPHIMRLLYAGNTLEDSSTFWNYNIWTESTIHLLLRLRGGMFHVSSGFCVEEEVEEVEEDLFLSSLMQQTMFVHLSK
jgi:hypothetical protein